MGGYKEHKIFDILKRKNIIIRYIVFIALIFIVTAMLAVQITKESKKQKNIVYKESSNLDYKVYLKENEFFDTRYLEEENQYIASLIDYIEANFRYELKAESDEDIDYRYTYRIVAEANVQDKTNQKTLYKFDEELIEPKEYITNARKKLVINEPIKIDYNRYNDIIKRFVDIYDLNNSNATVAINMYVNIIDDIKNNNKIDTPVVSLSIPLTTETMAIDIESNSVNANDISVCQDIKQGKYLFGIVLLIIIDIILIIKLVIFLKDTKDEKSVYNMRLRKIMSNYGSYIQKLNNEFDFEGHQILEIKSFEDLLQIKETLNKPILMTEKTLAMETYFFIPSDDNVYIYELKAGNLRKKRGKRYKVEETVEEINKKRIEEIRMTEVIKDIEED